MTFDWTMSRAEVEARKNGFHRCEHVMQPHTTDRSLDRCCAVLVGYDSEVLRRTDYGTEYRRVYRRYCELHRRQHEQRTGTDHRTHQEADAARSG